MLYVVLIPVGYRVLEWFSTLQFNHWLLWFGECSLVETIPHDLLWNSITVNNWSHDREDKGTSGVPIECYNSKERMGEFLG